jgi:hypothetical protein
MATLGDPATKEQACDSSAPAGGASGSVVDDFAVPRRSSIVSLGKGTDAFPRDLPKWYLPVGACKSRVTSWPS